MALLAYNCGNGKLRQAIKQAGSDDLSVLLNPDKKYLSLETRNFIRKILTLAFLANDRDFLLDKDASLMNYALSNEFAKVDVPSSASLKEIAKNLNMDLATFKKYNPQFKHNFTPPGKGYYMYIPLNKVAFFDKNFKAEKLAKVDTTIPMTRTYTFYTVNASFVKAVLSSQNTDLIHINQSVNALIKLSKKDNFNENFATFKRLANIATKNPHKVDESLFVQEAESKLYKAFQEKTKANSLQEKLENLFALKPFIDEFFNQVMINAEDEKLKNNRQALVYEIYAEFLKIADLKELSL